MFLLVLRRELRTPTPSHRDIALFFGASALLIATLTLQGLTRATPVRTLTLVVGAAALLLPYLLLRIVAGFAQTPSWVVRLAEVSAVISFVALALAPELVPAWLALLLVVYFAALAAYATYAFAQEAMHTGGVTGRRMQAAAIGSLALGAAIIFAIASAVDPPRADTWNILRGLMAVTSGLAYYVGFAPPTWLRQAWQAPALQAFLTEINRLPYLGDIQAVLTELERHAAAVVGAKNAAIGLWQESEGVLRFWTGLGSRPMVARYPDDLAARGIHAHNQVIDIPPDRIISGKAFIEQRPLFSSDVRHDDPENASLYIARDVRAVMAAPISAAERRVGVLTVWSPRPPIFVEGDMELLQLVARQSAVIFESRDLLQEVAEARAQAEADRLKDSFLASLSHDLRNPITAVGATAQLLRRRLDRAAPLDPERLRTSIASIETSAKQMADLVDQLLDYARVQMDRPLDLRPEPTDLVELTHRVVLLHEAVSERHHIQFESTETSLAGMWDQGRLERVLQNLVGNAIKYSPQGGEVTIRVSRDHDTVRDWATVAVHDHGIGIPDGDLPQIFNRFHRASNVRDRIPGTGIGLATARHVVEQHGGRIDVHSEEHRGSTFMVRLPLGEPPDADVLELRPRS